jgi:gamma-glutamyltranspeptidase/glutathione hydrolase/leukotriene-C4 hydrolase
LIQPAVLLCEKGFLIPRPLATNIRANEALIRRNNKLASIFINPVTNRTLAENDTLVLPDLARTLRLVMQYGAEVFYNGLLTPTVVREINENGGNVTVQDLNNYRVRVYQNHVKIRLDNEYTMFAPPPPSSAPLVAFIYRIMKGFSLRDERNMTQGEVNLFYHRLVESMKHAFAIRGSLGDSEFVDVSSVRFESLLFTFFSN